MAFDLKRIETEIGAAALESPYSVELAAAVVSDTFRLGGLVPPASAWWRHSRGGKAADALFGEQVGMLGWLLNTTSLREEAVAALRGGQHAPKRLLEGFFDTVRPLTGEMIRANAFRREEFLRRFVEAVGGQVAGETAEQSRRRLEQLDYRKTMADYKAAEQSRKEEAERRAKLLAEAAQREADARGWRE